MPLYVDIHQLGEFSIEDVAEAHAKDLGIQEQHGVSYLKYWCNQERGKVFCMCTAPSAEAAERVHMEAHGMRAERIIEVDEELAESLMGKNVVLPTGMAVSNGIPDPGRRTIMFTDIVGSTELTQKLGDRAAMELVEAHDRIVRAALAAHGGRQVKHLGDGIMAVFLSAEEACACATQIQRELRSHKGTTPAPIWLKIGAATGDPVERDGDFFGATVQLASRLCAQAAAGQTLVSSAVLEQANVKHADMGELSLKGFTAPVRAHRLVDDE
jgi:class 3 adenylate cyclase